MTRNARTLQDPSPLTAPVTNPDPVLESTLDPALESPEVDPVSASALEKRVKAVEAQQIGEAYTVVYGTGISLAVDPTGVDADGRNVFPESVTLGDGRKVAVVNGHVTLPKGARVAATTAAELDRLRLLHSVGQLAPAGY